MFLEFERELAELKDKIDQLEKIYKFGNKEVRKDLIKLKKEFKRKSGKVYEDLSPWERVQLARHPKRPHTSDYVKLIFKNFIELHGDRKFADDKAVIGGFAYFRGKPVAVIGHEKGRTTKEKMERNFGMPHPEGYRKAVRIMKLAEKFRMPLITFIDTPGAYPGIGAEERGQSEAIAESLFTMASLKIPTIAIVIGEGGSGGALAFGVADKILMMENAIYSVISPEGCAAILWGDQSKVKEASKALKLTSQDLYNMGIVDYVVREPYGASHWHYRNSARILSCYINACLRELCNISLEELLHTRAKKFEKIGAFSVFTRGT